jgi:hypothetical protein
LEESSLMTIAINGTSLPTVCARKNAENFADGSEKAPNVNQELSARKSARRSWPMLVLGSRQP